jgi:hypothetical protein
LRDSAIDTSVAGGRAQRIAHNQAQWFASRLSERIKHAAQLGGNPHDNRTFRASLSSRVKKY